MNEKEARVVLGDGIVSDDGSLYKTSDGYISWSPTDGDGTADTEGITLDGRFTPSQLEALAWWMRDKLK